MKVYGSYPTADIFGDEWTVWTVAHGNVILTASNHEPSGGWCIQSVNRVIPAESTTGRKAVAAILELSRANVQ